MQTQSTSKPDKSFVEYNANDQTFRCLGCRARIEIPRYVYRSPEALMIARDNFEARHRDEGCDRAAEVQEAIRFKPADQVTALRAAWGVR
jgi:hypothetical protein